jgi:hypothetical protein
VSYFLYWKTQRGIKEYSFSNGVGSTYGGDPNLKVFFQIIQMHGSLLKSGIPRLCSNNIATQVEDLTTLIADWRCCFLMYLKKRLEFVLMNIVANIKLPKLIWGCQDFENAIVVFSCLGGSMG